MSHSADLARGLADLCGQVAGSVPVVPAGGTGDGRIGTSAELVAAALTSADTGSGAVVLADLGSAVLTVRLVLDDLGRPDLLLADAPLVEGAVSAAVTAAGGGTPADVLAAAEEARGYRKL